MREGSRRRGDGQRAAALPLPVHLGSSCEMKMFSPGVLFLNKKWKFAV